MINLTRMLSVDEGIKTKVYTDTTGHKTVGIGFNMDDPKARGVWIYADIPESFLSVYNGISQLSMQSVWKILNVQINTCTTELKNIFQDYESYSDYVKYALINLVFNLGLTKFCQFSTFIKLVKAKEFETAADDLAKTAWATQLPNRAKRVVALLKGDDSLYQV